MYLLTAEIFKSVLQALKHTLGLSICVSITFDKVSIPPNLIVSISLLSVINNK